MNCALCVESRKAIRMREYIEVIGMVIKAVPVLETDKRITILTRERGKITAFARGAKKAGNRFMAATDPFAYGTFRLFEGKDAYSLQEVHIDEYFADMRKEFITAYYGMYFADLCDYYARENNDEKELLKLLYVTLKALLLDTIPNELVQYIFEVKLLCVNGEFPGVIAGHEMSETCAYTIQYIQNCSMEKLFTFTVSKQVLSQLKSECDYYRNRYIGKHFKSYDILKSCLEQSDTGN